MWTVDVFGGTYNYFDGKMSFCDRYTGKRRGDKIQLLQQVFHFKKNGFSARKYVLLKLPNRTLAVIGSQTSSIPSIVFLNTISVILIKRHKTRTVFLSSLETQIEVQLGEREIL